MLASLTIPGFSITDEPELGVVMTVVTCQQCRARLPIGSDLKCTRMQVAFVLRWVTDHLHDTRKKAT